jgi:regulator of cell morphogenesis and NO signaling
MHITEQTLVSEIAASVPASVRVFHRVGIDHSRGGDRQIGEACRQQRLSFADLTREIEALAAAWPRPDRDWNQQPLTALIDHLLGVYHASARAEMPRLEALATRVLRVHGARAPRLLGRIEAIVMELSAELNEHMRKEEMVLFPAMRALERGEPLPRPVPISSPLEVMEHEHEIAVDLLSELRTLTNGYTPPEWACETTRALYDGLARLERDLHVHVYLEDEILFPRTRQLAGVTRVH